MIQERNSLILDGLPRNAYTWSQGAFQENSGPDVSPHQSEVNQHTGTIIRPKHAPPTHTHTRDPKIYETILPLLRRGCTSTKSRHQHIHTTHESRPPKQRRAPARVMDDGQRREAEQRFEEERNNAERDVDEDPIAVQERISRGRRFATKAGLEDIAVLCALTDHWII